MDLDRDAIAERLKRLARQDRQRAVFGSASHNYTLNPPIDPAAIEAFESQHRIALPDDYRYFITQIGNGGAGPAYGMFPFGQDDEGRWGEVLPIGDVGQPFPHLEAWNLDESFWNDEPDIPAGMGIAEEERIWERWDQRLEETCWNPSIMNGAIPICHLGCALRQWLIVHGPQRGFVWNDMRADNAGLAPVTNIDGKPVTFSQWYLSWLDEAERSGRQQESGGESRAIQRPGARRRELLTLFLLVVAGVALGLLMALWRGLFAAPSPIVGN